MIDNLLVILSIFFPLLCILLMQIDWGELSWLNRVAAFRIILFIVFCSVFWVAGLEFPKITSYLEVYVIFFGIYSVMLNRRSWRRYDLSFIFPLVGLMIFVSADIWEWGIFVFINPGQWLDHIHRIYALIVWIVLLRFSGWKPNWKAVSFMIASILIPFLLIWVAPFPFWDFIVRIACLVPFGFSIVLGVEPDD